MKRILRRLILGIAVFAGHVVWMHQHRVSKPADAARADFAVLHAGAAGAALLASVALGVTLLMRPASAEMLHAAAAYGVVGLVGFLGQMIVAMEARLLPMAAWYWAYASADYRMAPPSPHTMRDRMLQAVVFAAWTLGVPALATGMFLESALLVGVGAWALFAGVVVATLDTSFVVGSTFRRRDASRDWSPAGSHVHRTTRAAQ